jgi:uncharacterized membrane protein (DUF485 family)
MATQKKKTDLYDTNQLLTVYLVFISLAILYATAGFNTKLLDYSIIFGAFGAIIILLVIAGANTAVNRRKKRK